VYYLYDFYRVYEQKELVDLGFELFSPALDQDKYGWSSELITFGMIAWAIIFGGSVFVVNRPTPIYALHILHRALWVVTICFIGRIVSFTFTLLPSPSSFCYPTDPEYNPPTTAWEIISRLDLFTGCGDLVFSSHTTYTTVCALVYIHYGSWKSIKVFVGTSVVCVGLLIIGLRRHYTVDVWLAWFIVPMVWKLMDVHWKDMYPAELMELEKEYKEKNEENDLELQSGA